jgi:glycerol-3-phosphate acyltransferase PlsY
MKPIKRIFLVLISIIIIAYLLGSINAGSFDITQWTQELRDIVSGVPIFGAIFYIMMYPFFDLL